MTTQAPRVLHRCNFCSKDQSQVKKLICGQDDVYICDECVDLCHEIVDRSRQPVRPAPNELTPSKIKTYLDEHVHGQQRAKRSLSIAVYNHYKRVNNPVVDGVEIDKSNILMIGSSGVGKTHMVTTLAKILDVPFAVVDATSLSQTGYVGLDPEECLARLYSAAEGDVEKAQQGIVFIDEIDKIGRKGENVSTTRDVSGEGVQQALLKIIEGSDVKFTPTGARKNPNGEFVTMNTSHILFILGGAFEGLADIIKHRDTRDASRMGFGSSLTEPDSKHTFNVIREVQVEDLISFGLIPELVGRLPVVTTLSELTEDALVQILTEPKNALVKQYAKLFSMEGCQLEFREDALHAIARKAKERKTGARGLRSIMEHVLIDTMFELPTLDGVAKVVVDEHIIEEGGKPLLVYREQAKASA